MKNNFELIYENNQYYPLEKEKKDYLQFLKLHRIYPESKLQSLFSGITKNHSFGKCPNCLYCINQYFFNFFIDQIIYIDGIDFRGKFTDILKQNLAYANNIKVECQKCGRDINIIEKATIIKLPKILIFTLQRSMNQHFSKICIMPDLFLDMKSYIDNSIKVNNTTYELYAINIKMGENDKDGHEICRVKRKGIWYEINDTEIREIKNPCKNFNGCIYGLYYNQLK